MPLYTHICVYRGGTHVEQGRFSNFKGFASGVLSTIPKGALPGLTPDLNRELAEKAYRCDWTAVPNRNNLWRAALTVGGDEFVIHAVRTAE